MNETEGFMNKLENTIKSNEKALDEMEDGTWDAATGLEKLSDSADETGDSLEGLEKRIDKDLLKGAADTFSNLADSVMDVAENSKEFMKISGQLEASSQKLGYTNEETQETFKQLYGVLDDDQTAATTTANLQALGLSQSELKMMTEGVIGAWAQYGDSIPIDGLAEAVNETVKAGQVTGTFADVLNWAGTSEDDFNERLAACGSESERANLIMQELANQGLVDSAAGFRESNKALIENNEANLSMKQSLEKLGEKALPIMTEITEAISGAIDIFNNLPGPVQDGAMILLGLFTVAGKNSTRICGYQRRVNGNWDCGWHSGSRHSGSRDGFSRCGGGGRHAISLITSDRWNCTGYSCGHRGSDIGHQKLGKNHGVGKEYIWPNH